MALPFASSLAGLANPSLAGLARLAHALAASRAALAIAQRFTTAASAAAGAAAAPAVAARLPTDRLQRAITPAVCQSLRHNGYAVIDGVFGEETAAALRGELQAMRGHMHKNHTHLVHGGATGLLEKGHIWEAELMQPETQALAPLCAQLQHDRTLMTMLSVHMPELSLHSQAIKLQWNAGHGGCFPMHFDSDTALDTRRCTAIWYLNPGWAPGDGGELRLYPFPQAAVDVAPASDRLVLFSSMHLLHRVLPSSAERFCCTIWMSAGGAQRRGGLGGGAGGAPDAERQALRAALARSEPLGTEEAWRLLMHPELRKHAAKYCYRDEWERSIRESHPEGPQLQQALGTFRREVDVIRAALRPLLPALEAGPPPGLPPPAWF